MAFETPKNPPANSLSQNISHLLGTVSRSSEASISWACKIYGYFFPCSCLIIPLWKSTQSVLLAVLSLQFHGFLSCITNLLYHKPFFPLFIPHKVVWFPPSPFINSTHQKWSSPCFRFSASRLLPTDRAGHPSACASAWRGIDVLHTARPGRVGGVPERNDSHKMGWTRGKLPFQRSRRGALYFTVQRKGKEHSSDQIRLNGKEQTISVIFSPFNISHADIEKRWKIPNSWTVQ